MKTTIVLSITHPGPISNLAEIVAQRAYTIAGVDNADVCASTEDEEWFVGSEEVIGELDMPEMKLRWPEIGAAVLVSLCCMVALWGLWRAFV